MALRIAFPIEKTFKLLRSDPSGETFVTVKQASYGEHAVRDDLMSEVTRVYSEGEERQVQVKANWSLPDLIRKEAFLTIADCNIEVETPVSDSSEVRREPLFRFQAAGGRKQLAMSEAEFNRAWNRLPVSWAMEIRECILEVNRDFAPGPN